MKFGERSHMSLAFCTTMIYMNPLVGLVKPFISFGSVPHHKSEEISYITETTVIWQFLVSIWGTQFLILRNHPLPSSGCVDHFQQLTIQISELMTLVASILHELSAFTCLISRWKSSVFPGLGSLEPCWILRRSSSVFASQSPWLSLA